METYLIIVLAITVVVVMILRFIQWRTRVLRWSTKLLQGKVVATPTKVSEWVTFTGMGFTIVGIIIGWFTLTMQNSKETLDARSKQLTDQINTLKQNLQSAEGEHREFAPHVDIHLISPIRDVSLIGDKVNFEWNFAQHTNLLDYLIEVYRLDRPDLPPNPRTINNSQCEFAAYRSCKFFATSPGSQRSQLLMLSADAGTDSARRLVEGEYLWRVVPAKKTTRRTRVDEEDNLVSDWSEYGSFSYYPSIIERIAKTRTVLVGTAYSVNVNFSRLNAGHNEGHDVDLIRLVVEGCLSIGEPKTSTSNAATQRNVITFEDRRCSAAVEAYLEKRQYESNASTELSRLSVQFKSFNSYDEGLDAVARKEVDAFIGSLTKAEDRENDAVRFTDGYYNFKTALCAHASSDETLEHWFDTHRSVGVLDNSTNHWLATLLAGEPRYQDKITIVAFPSFSILRSAFESRGVDGVLVDNVLLQDLQSQIISGVSDIGQDVNEIRGLEHTAAWRSYHERLGSQQEQFAIAIARDVETNPVRSGRMRTLFNLDLVDFRNDSMDASLYESIQQALHSLQIVRIRCDLRMINRLTGPCPDRVYFPALYGPLSSNRMM